LLYPLPRRPPISTLSPYPTLFRSRLDTRTLEAQRTQAEAEVRRAEENLATSEANVQLRSSERRLAEQELKRFRELFQRGHASRQDRKSTRLNSSHVKISYAVFCLK